MIWEWVQMNLQYECVFLSRGWQKRCCSPTGQFCAVHHFSPLLLVSRHLDVVTVRAFVTVPQQQPETAKKHRQAWVTNMEECLTESRHLQWLWTLEQSRNMFLYLSWTLLWVHIRTSGWTHIQWHFNNSCSAQNHSYYTMCFIINILALASQHFTFTPSWPSWAWVNEFISHAKHFSLNCYHSKFGV